MKDPLEKLLDHDTDDPIPPDHERRIREGLGSLLVPGPAPKADVPPPSGAAPLGKWLTIGAISVVAAGAGFVAGRTTAPQPPPTNVAPSVSVPAPPACVATEQTPPPPTTSTPLVASSPPPRPTASPVPSTDPFDREQSLLERARAALVRHDAAAAAQALDDCEQAFPASRHAEERDYLRIQVLREMGNTEQVRVHARRFLAKYPTSLLRSRVEPLAN